VDKIPDAYLVIVGNGKMLIQLKKQSQNLKIEDKIRFVGYINDQFLKTLYYKSADVFVLPSLTESFGLVLLEASACGLPLVVSNLEALKPIVKDGYNGMFIITGNENDIAKKLIYLLQNNDLRIKLGVNAKEYVKNYSMKRIAEETEKIYNKLLADKI
jgi:glycosyltransferase involved in cell wall biosynthesis